MQAQRAQVARFKPAIVARKGISMRKSIKKLFSIILFCLLAFLLTGCGEKPLASEFIPQGEKEEYLLYMNHEKGFAFTMPADWEYKENEKADQISFLSPKESTDDPFQENFYAGAGTSTNPLKKNITQQEVYDQLIQKAEADKGNLEGFAFMGYEYVVLANDKALKLTFSGESEKTAGLHITFTQWYLSKGATNYMCQYTAQTESYDTFLPVVEAALESFQYKE